MLRNLAAEAYPHEACALLVGRRGVIERVVVADNVHERPDIAFEVDPVVLLRAHREARESGRQVIGVFHSHPDHPARPSERDRARIESDGQIWLIAASGVDGVGALNGYVAQLKPKAFHKIVFNLTGS